MLFKSRVLRSYLRSLAHWVWTEQDAAFHFGLKLQEETITELLLLRIARECVDWPLKVRMFNKFQEGGSSKRKIIGNGADWEWYFATPACNIGFRVQAKVLHCKTTREKRNLSRGIYGGLKSDGKQADELIKSASRDHYNAIFIFYNHPWISNRDLFRPFHSPYSTSPGDWGCSVAPAKSVLEARDNKLSTLIPHMIPWDRFFGFGRRCRAQDAFRDLGVEQEILLDTPRPEWLSMIDQSGQEGEVDGESDINRYLTARGLAGVAYFELLDDFED